MWPTFSPTCRKDIDRVLRSGRLTGYRANRDWGVGPQDWSEAYAFEREVEKAFKVNHAIAVNSGTAALHAGLSALNLNSREVITSPLTFSATVSAIILAGGTPRFADVDPHTFCITKETVAPLVTKKTAAILSVHLFGYFPDLSGLLGLGLPVLEDACQSVGASRGGRFAGTVGVGGAMSFNGSKNICAGEGGAYVTNDGKMAEKVRRFINHGENFGSTQVGVNYRMHELVAVLARHGLRELEARNQRRRELARLVQHDWFMTMSGSDVRMMSIRNMRENHVFYVMPFQVMKNRARFIKRCAKRGLTVGAGYITPTLDKYPAFKKYVTHDLPVAHELSEKTLCILSNLSPDKPLSEARRTARIIREALE